MVGISHRVENIFKIRCNASVENKKVTFLCVIINYHIRVMSVSIIYNIIILIILNGIGNPYRMYLLVHRTYYYVYCNILITHAPKLKIYIIHLS